MQTKSFSKYVQPVLVILFSLMLCACSGGGDSNSNANPPSNQAQASGEQDSSFGTNGVVTTEVSGFYDEPEKIFIQPDGGILVAGDFLDGTNFSFAITKYNSIGVLDKTYGNNGIASVVIGPAAYWGGAAQQSDGKVVLAGWSTNSGKDDIVLVRFGTDGALDSSFGIAGIYRSPAGVSEGANAVVIQSDGKIVVAGYSKNSADGSMDFLLARYTSAGVPDPSFGTNGAVKTPVPSSSGIIQMGQLTTLAIASDGSIVAAGLATTYYQTSSSTNLAIAKFTSNGTLDTSFGTPALTLTTYANSPHDMVFQADGKIVIAATPYLSSGQFSLIRFDQNGLVDTSYGSGGTALAAIGDNHASTTALSIQSDGKIVAAGQTVKNDQYSLAVARFNTNGTLDTSFGNEGAVISTFGIGSMSGEAVAIQKDGKILAAVPSKVGNSIQAFTIVRYFP